MSMTAGTSALNDGARGQGIVSRLFGPFVALRNAYRETERAIAANLLTHDDATLHLLGYDRAELKAGIVRCYRAD